jgi:hypothetical protein
MIPYVGLVWMLGWEMQYQRNVAWGRAVHVPDWSDFKGQALLGLKSLLAILPYSLAMNVITTPLIIGGAFLSVAGADPDSAQPFVAMALTFGAAYVLIIVMTVGLLPLTGSIMLRVSLFGTIESGFQLKETCRLMREAKGDLKRAWGFSVLNLGITYFVMFAVAAVLIASVLLALQSQSWAALAAIVLLAPVVGIVVVLPLSLFLGLAHVHYFAQYGRRAYGLDGFGEPA